jgi:hypothetical protein
MCCTCAAAVAAAGDGGAGGCSRFGASFESDDCESCGPGEYPGTGGFSLVILFDFQVTTVTTATGLLPSQVSETGCKSPQWKKCVTCHVTRREASDAILSKSLAKISIQELEKKKKREQVKFFL